MIKKRDNHKMRRDVILYCPSGSVYSLPKGVTTNIVYSFDFSATLITIVYVFILVTDEYLHKI